MEHIKLCESQEDYLKEIYLISKQHKGGWVSNSDIAEEMQVKPSSVTSMLYKLRELKMIIWSPRKSIRLTEKGKKVAEKLLTRYELLIDFFKKVFLLENEILIDSFCCEIEHKVTPELFELISELNEYYEGQIDGNTLQSPHNMNKKELLTIGVEKK